MKELLFFNIWPIVAKIQRVTFLWLIAFWSCCVYTLRRHMHCVTVAKCLPHQALYAAENAECACIPQRTPCWGWSAAWASCQWRWRCPSWQGWQSPRQPGIPGSPPHDNREQWQADGWRACRTRTWGLIPWVLTPAKGIQSQMVFIVQERNALLVLEHRYSYILYLTFSISCSNPRWLSRGEPGPTLIDNSRTVNDICKPILAGILQAQQQW